MHTSTVHARKQWNVDKAIENTFSWSKNIIQASHPPIRIPSNLLWTNPPFGNRRFDLIVCEENNLALIIDRFSYHSPRQKSHISRRNTIYLICGMGRNVGFDTCVVGYQHKINNICHRCRHRAHLLIIAETAIVAPRLRHTQPTGLGLLDAAMNPNPE
jgi:hypothetical protein